MTAAAYLAADAAQQADRELPAFCHPRRLQRVTPNHVLEELDYAANLFQRADRAITAELIALEAAGIDLEPSARRMVGIALSQLAFHAQLAAMRAREANKR